MSDYLERLRERLKKSEPPQGGTLKTLKTPLLQVLRVAPPPLSEKFAELLPASDGGADAGTLPCDLPPTDPDRAALPVAPHPCPPLPRNFRWRDTSPLAELDTDPDDTRIRCAYCRHWRTVQRHGRVKPWCSVKDDWEEPSTLHHCTVERFEFDPAHNWRRWLLADDDSASGES